MQTSFKRSRKAALVLMVPVAGVSLSACVQEPAAPAVVYETLADCQDAGVLTREECQASLDQAKALHSETAPKFDSRAACEADYGQGQCQTTSSGFFMPAMMGFLAGQLLNRGAGAAQLSPRVPAQPLYKKRDDANGFSTGTGAFVSRNTGPVMVQPKTVQPQPGRLVQRNGFGAGGTRMSFGG
jgi:uncharacterized protein YgiB involved in biofilm formation